MGTKNKPGVFDCYSNAKPDEPIFVLLARDPLAGFLVSIWAKIRNGDAEAANAVYHKMLSTYVDRYLVYPDVDKANEATECAMAMFKYHKELIDANS